MNSSTVRSQNVWKILVQDVTHSLGSIIPMESRHELFYGVGVRGFICIIKYVAG
jgi:hypothetical protein